MPLSWENQPARPRKPGRHRRARRAARHAAKRGCLALAWLAGWLVVVFLLWAASGGWQL